MGRMYRGNWTVPENLSIFIREHDNVAYVCNADDIKSKEKGAKWARGYSDKEIKSIDIPNTGFDLKVLHCAGNSLNGGKLSFWTCELKRGDLKFELGVSAESLLELIQDTTMVNGICTKQVVFARKNGRQAVLGIGTKTYNDVMKLLNDKIYYSNGKTSKWEPGYVYETQEKNDVYLCDLYVPLVFKKYISGTCSNGWMGTHIYELKDKALKKVIVSESDFTILNRNIDNITMDEANYYLSSQHSIINKLPARKKSDRKYDVAGAQEKFGIFLDNLRDMYKNPITLTEDTDKEVIPSCLANLLITTDGVITLEMLDALDNAIKVCEAYDEMHKEYLRTERLYSEWQIQSVYKGNYDLIYDEETYEFDNILDMYKKVSELLRNKLK